MVTLSIDIGNTKIKAGIFIENELTETFVFDKNEIGKIESLVRKFLPTHTVLSSVGETFVGLENMLAEKSNFIKLSHQTKLPFTSTYQTPQTLGVDRIAAVAGAVGLFSDKNCLVIDMGTCITFDFVSDNCEYFGGAISPGLNMRLQAMHQFTKKLPLVSFRLISEFIGNTTETSILSGAFFGVVGEINQTIERYEEQFGPIQVITCGGDSALFDKHIKRDIFAAPFLVLYGLNKISSINV